MNDLHRAPSAAYIHIPFCIRKCGYCDFVSYTGLAPEKRQAYVSALKEEIRTTAAWAATAFAPDDRRFPEPLQTAYFGGGTPTVLDAGDLAGILEELENRFGLSPDAEITLEANPGTVNICGLSDCRKAGFNRISFGLQALQPKLLKTLGRLHSPQDFYESVNKAVQAGFSSINVDIMFGVPGQSLKHISETLRSLMQLSVDHISFYSLTLEPETPLYEMAKDNPGLMPPEELERAEYWLICKILKDNGFDHYEISNAARPGFCCRHNLTYWKGLPYYGFGLAAHSYIQGFRRSNEADLDLYIRAFDHNTPRTAFAAGRILESIDEQAAQKEMIILGLRLLEGVRFKDFQMRFGCDLRRIFANPVRQLVDRRLLVLDRQGIRLTPAGLDLANQVFMEFI